jgi:chloramphenicol 3-O-phosphotransferase
MWRRISRPQFLVCLDASPNVIAQRRGSLPEDAYIAEQRRRLAHARDHCQFYVDTDALEPDEVATRVVSALEQSGLERDGPSSGEHRD